jgi:tetratricopeptide (TPR) repeat protein
MDAVTYPDDNVALFLNTSMVPVRLQFNAKPYAKDFNVMWTPTIITLDENGKEHYRTVGFLSAAELIPSLLMGIAKVHFDLGRLNEALAAMEKIIADYPKSKAAPEAVFHRGVASYKSTHDPKPLRAAYDKLVADYPSSDWADRAQPYRLIQ